MLGGSGACLPKNFEMIDAFSCIFLLDLVLKKYTPAMAYFVHREI